MRFLPFLFLVFFLFVATTSAFADEDEKSPSPFIPSFESRNPLHTKTFLDLLPPAGQCIADIVHYAPQEFFSIHTPLDRMFVPPSRKNSGRPNKAAEIPEVIIRFSDALPFMETATVVTSRGRHLSHLFLDETKVVLAQRQLEMARNGYELFTSRFEDGILEMRFVRRLELINPGNQHLYSQEPDYIVEHREVLKKRITVARGFQAAEGSRRTELTIPGGTPLTAVTLPHIKDGVYNFVVLYGENFMRIGPARDGEGKPVVSEMKHNDIGACEPAASAGEILIKNGVIVDVIIGWKTGTYAPGQLWYFAVAVEALWEQRIFPDKIVATMSMTNLDDRRAFFVLEKPKEKLEE